MGVYYASVAKKNKLYGKLTDFSCYGNTKRRSASGCFVPWPPDQGLCLWTQLGAVAQTTVIRSRFEFITWPYKLWLWIHQCQRLIASFVLSMNWHHSSLFTVIRLNVYTSFAPHSSASSIPGRGGTGSTKRTYPPFDMRSTVDVLCSSSNMLPLSYCCHLPSLLISSPVFVVGFYLPLILATVVLEARPLLFHTCIDRVSKFSVRSVFLLYLRPPLHVLLGRLMAVTRSTLLSLLCGTNYRLTT